MIEYFENILYNQPENILRLLTIDAWADTQMNGKAEGHEQILALAQKETAFYKGRVAKIKSYNEFGDEQFDVVEQELVLTSGKVLPVAIIGERHGHRYQSVRVYHSTYPFTESHAYRPPVLYDAIELSHPEIIAQYFDALHRGDVEGVIKTFAGEMTYFREPAGWEWTYRGLANLRAHYAQILAEGGIHLHFHQAVFDPGAPSFGVEFTCDAWGKTKLRPRQAWPFTTWIAPPGKSPPAASMTMWT